MAGEDIELANLNASATAPTEHEIHQPLNVTKREVRLLKLLPPVYQGSSQLAFSLKVFSLNEKPDFLALSYCWGTDAAQHEISINGKIFRVRPNLYEYLRLMHAERGEAWIFIDAICINQNDTTERNNQVGLMGDVYRDASEVIAWLGIRDGVDPLSDEILVLWQAWFDECLRILLSIVQSYREGSHDYERLLRDLPDTPAPMQTLKSTLAEQAYWTRLWVVQELTLAQKLTFRYKSLRMDGRVLRPCFEGDFSNIIKELGVRGAEEAPALLQASRSLKANMPTGIHQEMRAAFLLRERDQNSTEARQRALPLNRAVIAYADQECSILNDRIFGLLGMTTTLIKPDYQFDAQTIYISALIQGLCEIQASHSVGNFGGQPATKQLKTESARYTLRLAKCLGIGLHRSMPRFLTEEILKLFGVDTKWFYVQWSTRNLDPLAFAKYGNFGKASYPKACVLLARTMHARTQLSKLTGWLDKEFMQESSGPIRTIHAGMISHAREFQKIDDELKRLPSMDLEEARKLISRIVKFPSESGAARLGLKARQKMFSRIEAATDESSREALLEVIGFCDLWHTLLQGLTSKGVNATLGPNMEQELLNVHAWKVGFDNSLSMVSLSQELQALDADTALTYEQALTPCPNGFYDQAETEDADLPKVEETVATVRS